MLNIIAGEKNSAKTLTAHKVLQSSVKNGYDTMLIVPKQFTFESDKGILSLLGPKDACKVDVLSFSRLAHTVLTTYGGITKPFAKQGARVIFMSLAIQALKDSLTVFAKHKNEFLLVNKLLSCVDELKNSGIEPEYLEELASFIEDNILKNKLLETALIYRTYEAIVANSHFDDADLLMKIYEILLPTDFFNDKVIVIDGFAQFTYPELRLISLAIKKAKEVYITLCSDNVADMSELTAFAYSNKTFRRLRALAAEKGVDINVIYTKERENKVKSKELLYLTKNLFSAIYEPYEGSLEDIEIMNASCLQGECDAVARKIKSFIMNGTYRYRDICVVYRDDERYEKALRLSFKKYAVDFFEDKRQPVSNQPLVNFIRNVLLICADGFESDYIFRLLKTGLFPIEQESISNLENYVFVWDLNKKDWLSDWTQNPDGFGFEMNERRQKALSELNELRKSIVLPLEALRQSIKDVSGKKAITLLFNFIKDIKADEELKKYALSLEKDGFVELAVEQEQVWELLVESFDEIATTLSENVVSAKRLYEIFELIINSKTLGKLPDGYDEVYICSAERILTKNARVVFAIGMNQGVFPLAASDNGLFSSREKRKIELLGTKIGDDIKEFTIKERFLLYSTFASCEEKLFITYSTSNLKGEKLSKSEAVEKVQKIMPSITEVCADDDDIKQLILGEKSAFEYLARHYNDNSGEVKALKEYFSAKSNYKGRINAIERAVGNAPFELKNKESAVSLFGKNMSFSATRVETFSKCPFMYFCKYGLYLKPRKSAKLDAALGGTVVHYVLEIVLKNNKGKAFLSLDDEALQKQVDDVLFEYMKSFMGGKESVTDRFYYLFSRMRKVIFNLLKRLKAEFDDSDFEPFDFELDIGKDERVKPFKIGLENGYVELIGVIDRVDKMDLDGKRYIRIVDYKTGVKKFSLSDVFSGFNMQMLLYLMSIWRTGSGDYENIIPSGVLYFPARFSAFSGERHDDEEARYKNSMAQAKMNGMLVNEGESIARMDKNKTGLFIPIKYDKNTGEATGEFITLSQLKKLGNIIDNTIKEMGESLHNGLVEASPVFTERYKDTCSYCDYKDICLNESPDYKFVKSMKHEECLKIIEAGEDNE